MSETQDDPQVIYDARGQRFRITGETRPPKSGEWHVWGHKTLGTVIARSEVDQPENQSAVILELL